MFRSLCRALPLAACASFAFASSAFAQAPADTLARIRETRSITLGVRPEHYPIVSRVMVQTLREGSEDAWCEELEKD